MRKELVSEWMTTPVIAVAPTTLLSEVNELMVSKMIRRLPVMDNGRLVGIVTYGDVRDARPSRIARLNVWEVNYLVVRLTVREIMTPNPVTISPQATIAEAAQIMLKNMISGLPVVDDGRLVGIITESDIFRLVAREWVRQEAEEAAPYARYQ